MTDKRHWAENEEILEDYVLGRIDVALREPMDRHLTACAGCRKLVEEETILAAGIRRTGAVQTKEQLRTLIRGKEPDIPWPHIFSMAAALFLIIGIGMYNRWFFRSASPTLSHESVEEKQKDKEKEQGAGEYPEFASGDAANEVRKRSSEQEVGMMDDQRDTPVGSGVTQAPSPAQTQNTAPRSYTLAGHVLGRSPMAPSEMQAEAEHGLDAVGARSLGKMEPATKEVGRTMGNLVVRFTLTGKPGGANLQEPLACSLEHRDRLFFLTVHLNPGFTLPDSSSVQASLASPESLVISMNGTTISIELPAEVSGQIAP